MKTLFDFMDAHPWTEHVLFILLDSIALALILAGIVVMASAFK